MEIATVSTKNGTSSGSPATRVDPSGLWSVEEIKCCIGKTADGIIDGCAGGGGAPSLACLYCILAALYGCFTTPFCPIWFTGCGAVCGAAFVACVVGAAFGALAKILECLLKGECDPQPIQPDPCIVACSGFPAGHGHYCCMARCRQAYLSPGMPPSPWPGCSC